MVALFELAFTLLAGKRRPCFSGGSFLMSGAGTYEIKVLLPPD